MKPFLLLACASLVVPLLLAADKDRVTIELPAETITYKPGKGVELAQALCATCHSADYLSSQPRMERKFWEASVKKMNEKFGAPLPGDTTALVDYLTAAYGKP